MTVRTAGSSRQDLTEVVGPEREFSETGQCDLQPQRLVVAADRCVARRASPAGCRPARRVLAVPATGIRKAFGILLLARVRPATGGPSSGTNLAIPENNGGEEERAGVIGR